MATDDDYRPSDGLDGKVALVTGASSGIGARRADRLESLATELDTSGARVLVVDLDVTDEEACTAPVARTVDEPGRIDILVNAAGPMLPGPIVGADTETGGA